MAKGRYWLAAAGGLAALVLAAGPAAADSVSIGINTPGVSFNLNVGARPQLVPVPGLPVYRAPLVEENYFFYGGHYYVEHLGVWYISAHHNGPWVVARHVPQPVLAVPVAYYKIPPGHAKREEHWKSDDHGKGHERGERGKGRRDD